MAKSKIRFGLLLVILMSVLIANTAVAQPTPEQIAGANACFQRGADLFFAEKYEEAIGEFRAAHALVPNPIFLYNIALAYVSLGDHRQALFHAEEAKRSGLTGEDSIKNDARIVGLRRQVQAIEVSATVRTEPDPEPVARTSVIPKTVYGWIGVGTAGVGVASLVTFAIFEGLLRPDIREYEEAAENGNASDYRTLKSRIESRQSIAKITLFSGLGLFAL